MIDFAIILKILPIFVIALISPGPDFMIVSSTSLINGRIEGIKAAAGVASVISIYTFVSLIGLSALFEHYLWLVYVFKIGGGLYLLYLGYLLIRGSFAESPAPHGLAKKELSSRNSYWAGVITCITNPKAIAFFASIFALALTSDTSFATKLAIEVVIPLTAFIWFSLVTLGLSTSVMRARYYRWKRTMNRVTGMILAFIGIKLLLQADH